MAPPMGYAILYSRGLVTLFNQWSREQGDPPVTAEAEPAASIHASRTKIRLIAPDTGT